MVAGICCVGAYTAHAANIQFSVAQQKFAFDLNPGEERTVTIAVTNNSDVPIAIGAQMLDYRVEDDNRIVVENIDEYVRSLRQWMSMETAQVSLAPHATEPVVVRIHVPEDAALGSHHGLIAVHTISDTADAQGAQVMTQGQIGVHVLLNVRGDAHATGTVTSFTAPLFVSRTATYAVVFRNTGNVHYVPAAVAHVRNISTQSVHTVDLNAADRFAFPGTNVTLTGTQDAVSRWGLYRVGMRIVDGDGTAHTRTRVMMGMFFPVIIVAFGGVCAGALVWARRTHRTTNPSQR